MAKLYEVWNQVDISSQRGYLCRSLTLSMLNSAWYCGTKAFRGSVRILTREPSSKECKLTTTGRRPTNSGIIPNSTRSRASTWLSSLSRSALSSRTSGWEFLKMSSSFSFEPRSLIGAPKPITWIEERLVSKGRHDEENTVERHSSSLMNYSKNPHTRTCGLRTPRLKFGKKGAYI